MLITNGSIRDRYYYFVRFDNYSQLTLAKGERPEETLKEVLGDNLLVKLESRQDITELGILD